MHLKIAGLSHRLAADTKGGVAIVTAFAIPVILGFSALALEYGAALQTKSKNQRTSDIAAFAAAHAYNRTANASDKEAAAIAAAESIAALNGVSSTGVTVSFEDTTDKGTIDVTVSEDKPIYLSRLLRPDDSVTINTLSRVALGQGGGGFKACIVALDPDAESGLRINGIPAGDYNMTGCGVGSNAPIAVNGDGMIGTRCAAPEFDPGADNPSACNEDTVEHGFTDPFTGITDWPRNPSDNTVCDHIGSFPDDFKTGNSLVPGVLCVTGLGNGNFGTVESDPDGEGNVLIIRSGVDFKMEGNESLSIKPQDTGDFAGVALYAPESHIELAGTPDFSKFGLGCLGLVAGSWTFSGNVTMKVTAKCEKDDPYFDDAGTGNGGRPLLIQ